MKNNERTQNTARFLLNSLLIIVCSLFFYYIWYRFYRDRVYFYRKGNWLILTIYMVSLMIFNSLYGGFRIGYAKISDLVFSQTIALLFSNFIIFVLASLVRKSFLPHKGFWIYFLIQIVIVIVMNFINRWIFFKLFSPQKTILIYGTSDEFIYERMVQNQSHSYKIEKRIKYDEIGSDFDILDQYECVLVVDLDQKAKSKLVNECFKKMKSIYIVPDIYDIIMNNAKSVYLVDTPVMKANSFGPSQIAKVVKRAFDIFFAVVLMVITSPIWLITAICIKATDGGPVFYKQVRVTQYGREFKIIKFRSMKIDAEKDGVARLASEHDDRITKVGKFIRACRIDELPQLWNIFIGDMSVVGPRPERPELIVKILEEVPEFNYRLKVKAGLTGYAQVYGKYNTKLKDKLLYDLYYIEKFSILLDVRIMFMTFKILFMKESTEGVDVQK